MAMKAQSTTPFKPNYPTLESDLVEQLLRSARPVWILSPSGIVRGANLLAYWIWGAIGSDNELRKRDLLGNNVFTVLNRNVSRIPTDLNYELYAKKIAVLKRLISAYGSFSYAPFVATLQADPNGLREMYEWGIWLSEREWQSDREWEYPLRIVSPTPGRKILRFRVTVSGLEDDAGFLALYDPVGEDVSLIERQFHLLNERFEGDAYVQIDSPHYPEHYPKIVHDDLWNITYVNDAAASIFQLAVGDHFLGANFTENGHEVFGDDLVDQLRRMVGYFLWVAAEYRNRGSSETLRYREMIHNLSQLPPVDGHTFQDMVAEQEYLGVPRLGPFGRACNVYPRISLGGSASISLDCAAMIQHGSESSDHWMVTQVPQSPVSEAALILWSLKDIWRDTPIRERDEFQQARWGLITARTLVEGLTWRSASDVWNAPDTFARLEKTLDKELELTTPSSTDDLIAILYDGISNIVGESLWSAVESWIYTSDVAATAPMDSTLASAILGTATQLGLLDILVIFSHDKPQLRKWLIAQTMKERESLISSRSPILGEIESGGKKGAISADKERTPRQSRNRAGDTETGRALVQSFRRLFDPIFDPGMIDALHQFYRENPGPIITPDLNVEDVRGFRSLFKEEISKEPEDTRKKTTK